MFIDKTGVFDIMQNDDPQNIKILTVEEVADILRIHRSTVSRYAMAGELRSHVIGNRRLFKDSDVWAFFENQADRNCVARKEY
jgi:excisionase family DNA binding protein